MRSLRLDYEDYCRTGYGDPAEMLTRAILIIDGASQRLATERSHSAQLQTEINLMRKQLEKLLSTVDPPAEYRS